MYIYGPVSIRRRIDVPITNMICVLQIYTIPGNVVSSCPGFLFASVRYQRWTDGVRSKFAAEESVAFQPFTHRHITTAKMENTAFIFALVLIGVSSATKYKSP